MVKQYLFTSEAVAEGHPDKVCDQISDTLLDAYLTKDENARVAIEALATTNLIVLAGEVSAEGGAIPEDETEEIVRNLVRDIGYDQQGFSYKSLKIKNYIHAQSPDIAMGVVKENNTNIGAGDQGIMFGYATDEAKDAELMPATLYYSNAILQALANARHSGAFPELRPDAKSQVTLLYEDGIPVKAKSIVVSTQHDEKITPQALKDLVMTFVLAVMPPELMDKDTVLYVNPTGRFVIGGPDGDTGLTGRKIIVDTYGGAVPHGGGAFSGKDASKVDRSAAYMARYMAKNVVASGLAKKCLIQIAYAIGVAKPLAVYVNTYGTGAVDDDKLAQLLPEIFDLTPAGIIKTLGLKKPIFRKTATYGHFGRKPEEEGAFSWERTDKIDLIKSAVS